MEKFWKKVRRGGDDECWPWQAGTSKFGYGRFSFRAANWQAHRVAFTLTHGEVPAGMVVMHTCNNRLCCNPAHLQAGTQQDNIKHAVACGRTSRAKLGRVFTEQEIAVAQSAPSYRVAAQLLRAGHRAVLAIRKLVRK
jgi:hypothetical protein